MATTGGFWPLSGKLNPVYMWCIHRVYDLLEWFHFRPRLPNCGHLVAKKWPQTVVSIMETISWLICTNFSRSVENRSWKDPIDFGCNRVQDTSMAAFLLPCPVGLGRLRGDTTFRFLEQLVYVGTKIITRCKITQNLCHNFFPVSAFIEMW